MTPNDKLLEEIREQIKIEAEEYKKKPHYRGGEPLSVSPQLYLKIGYIAGATAWAPWKVKHDELKTLLDKQLTTQQELLKAAEVSQALLQYMADALEALLNVMPKGDSLRYFHAKEKVIAGRQLLQQFKDGKGKEVGDEK